MRVRNPLKIILVMFISILCLAGKPSAALADAENSSPSFLGSSKMCQTIQGAPLAQSSTLSRNPGPGPLRKISAPGSVIPRTLATRAIPQRGGRDLMAPRSLRGPLAFLPRSTVPPNRVALPATRQPNRFAPNQSTDKILAQARNYLGTPYRRGGSLENGRATDCSGFVQHVYQKSNIDLPRSSSEQAREGTIVSRTLDFAKMRPGDLLFFGNRGRHINHVGIYAGDGTMIHASNSQGRVIVSDLSQPYHEGTFVMAKRLPEVQPPK